MVKVVERLHENDHNVMTFQNFDAIPDSTGVVAVWDQYFAFHFFALNVVP